MLIKNPDKTGIISNIKSILGRFKKKRMLFVSYLALCFLLGVIAHKEDVFEKIKETGLYKVVRRPQNVLKGLFFARPERINIDIGYKDFQKLAEGYLKVLRDPKFAQELAEKGYRRAIEKFSIVKALQAIEASDAVIVLLDACDGVSDQDISLIGLVLDRGRSLTIGVNKWDGLPEDQRSEVRMQLDRKLPFLDFVDC